MKLVYESKIPLFEEITGEQFNRSTKDLKFYKLTRFAEIDQHFKYQTGLNIDTNFKSVSNFPGLYFIEEKYVQSEYNWRLKVFKDFPCDCQKKFYKRMVTIQDDARVFCEYKEIKADKIILGEREEL